MQYHRQAPGRIIADVTLKAVKGFISQSLKGYYNYLVTLTKIFISLVATERAFPMGSIDFHNSESETDHYILTGINDILMCWNGN